MKYFSISCVIFCAYSAESNVDFPKCDQKNSLHSIDQFPSEYKEPSSPGNDFLDLLEPVETFGDCGLALPVSPSIACPPKRRDTPRPDFNGFCESTLFLQGRSPQSITKPPSLDSSPQDTVLLKKKAQFFKTSTPPSR